MIYVGIASVKRAGDDYLNPSIDALLAAVGRAGLGSRFFLWLMNAEPQPEDHGVLVDLCENIDSGILQVLDYIKLGVPNFGIST